MMEIKDIGDLKDVKDYRPCTCDVPPCTCGAAINLSDNDINLIKYDAQYKSDLKKIVKRWKKEAKFYRNRAYEDGAKCRCLDLTLEMCVESIEALLCVRAP
ncbi:MAG TPA: hypothetical protein ENH60_09830 [Pricia sp.]|nr:hypothetical protein [Pricia sp.]